MMSRYENGQCTVFDGHILNVLKSTVCFMNDRNLDMTSHFYKGLGNCSISIASQCPKIHLEKCNTVSQMIPSGSGPYGNNIQFI